MIHKIHKIHKIHMIHMISICCVKFATDMVFSCVIQTDNLDFNIFEIFSSFGHHIGISVWDGDVLSTPSCSPIIFRKSQNFICSFQASGSEIWHTNSGLG